MSNEELKKEIEDLMGEMKIAAEVFKIADEMTSLLNGKESITALGVSALVSAKVIFGCTSERKEAYSALTVHFAKIFDMIDSLYEEQEEEAEESTKQ